MRAAGSLVMLELDARRLDRTLYGVQTEVT